MSYGIGAKVEVITTCYSGRWIYPLEKGTVVGRHISAGQEVYDVRLEDDGKEYTFGPNEIEELQSA